MFQILLVRFTMESIIIAILPQEFIMVSK